MVAFQRSRSSSGETLQFTVNLGVFCNRIFAILNNAELATPGMEDCHLWERIGLFLPSKSDKWWSVDGTTDAAVVVTEMWTVLEKAGLPYLLHYLKDENLRDLWLAGGSPGLTEMQRWMNLSALCKTAGWGDCFRTACDQLRAITKGKSSSAAAELTFGCWNEQLHCPNNDIAGEPFPAMRRVFVAIHKMYELSHEVGDRKANAAH